jgi:hypothetical protein
MAQIHDSMGDFCGGAILVTFSDSADIPGGPYPIWITGTGAVKVTTADGDTFLFTNPAAGTITPFLVKRVWATTTTVSAGQVVALKHR